MKATRGRKNHIRLILVMVSAILCLASDKSYALNDLLEMRAQKDIKASSALLLDVVKAGGRLVSVGERGLILYSDDNGIHWSQADVPTSVTLTAVNFPTPKKGWAVGFDGVVLHTTDSGKTWKKQLDGLQGHKLSLAHAEKLLSEKSGGAAEELQNTIEEIRSSISGGRWGDPLMDVWFKDESEGFVIGSYGLIYHTSDGGASWAPWWDRIDNPDKFHFYAMTEAKGALIIAGESGGLYKSVDKGNTWKKLSSPYDGSFFGLHSSPVNEYVFTYGLGGTIARSLDAGETWELMKTAASGTLSCSTEDANNNVIIISYTGEIVVISKETFTSRVYKIGASWSGTTSAADGSLILVGLKGVQRVHLNQKL